MKKTSKAWHLCQALLYSGCSKLFFHLTIITCCTSTPSDVVIRQK